MIERGILSLWTRTPQFRIRRGALLIQTLAVCLANRVFPETGLVTDARGLTLAALLGWRFTDTSTALDDCPTDGFEHIWALGKLYAATLQNRPFLQFDGDVHIFEPLPGALLSAPILAQSPDFPEFYLGADMASAFAIGERAEPVTAYNAGLVGGSDLALVKSYAWSGIDLARRFRRCALNGTTTSMFVEQYALGLFAQRAGVPVATLYSEPVRDPDLLPGYLHLTGELKQDPERIASAEAQLGDEFPEEYQRFLRGWDYLSHPHLRALDGLANAVEVRCP